MNPAYLYLGGLAVHALIWQFGELLIQEYGEKLAALVTGKPLNQVPRKDAEGIPIQLYRDGGLHYNPLFVAARAKRIFTHDVNAPQYAEFIKLTDWLLQNSTSDGSSLLFPYHFDLPSLRLKAPWYSCLAQAVALTCFAQRSTLSEGDIWKEHCSGILQSLSPEKGLGLRLSADKVWFPEYTTNPHVLNGMLAVLLELHSTWKLTGLNVAQRLFEQGFNAVVSILPDFDYKGFSRYDLLGNLASRNYHVMHLDQLRRLLAIRSDAVVSRFLRKWSAFDRVPVLFQLLYNPRPKRIAAFWGSLVLIFLAIWLLSSALSL